MVGNQHRIFVIIVRLRWLLAEGNRIMHFYGEQCAISNNSRDSSLIDTRESPTQNMKTEKFSALITLYVSYKWPVSTHEGIRWSVPLEKAVMKAALDLVNDGKTAWPRGTRLGHQGQILRNKKQGPQTGSPKRDAQTLPMKEQSKRKFDQSSFDDLAPTSITDENPADTNTEIETNRNKRRSSMNRNKRRPYKTEHPPIATFEKSDESWDFENEGTCWPKSRHTYCSSWRVWSRDEIDREPIFRPLYRFRPE